MRSRIGAVRFGLDDDADTGALLHDFAEQLRREIDRATSEPRAGQGLHQGQHT